jgi:hypothetical protein
MEVQNNPLKDVKDTRKKGANKTKRENGKGKENDHVKDATSEVKLKRTKRKETPGSKHKIEQSSKSFLGPLLSYFTIRM